MNGSQLKSRLRECLWHFHQANLLDSKTGLRKVSDSSLSPEVVYCNKKNNVVGARHGVL